MFRSVLVVLLCGAPLPLHAQACPEKEGPQLVACLEGHGAVSDLSRLAPLWAAYRRPVALAAAEIALRRDPTVLARFAGEGGEEFALVSIYQVARRQGIGGRATLTRRARANLVTVCHSHLNHERQNVHSAAARCALALVEPSDRAGVMATLPDRALVAVMRSPLIASVVPNAALSQRLLDWIDRPIDESAWRQSDVQPRAVGCRLLQRVVAPLGEANLNRLRRSAERLEPFDSMAADACRLAAIVRSP